MVECGDISLQRHLSLLELLQLPLEPILRRACLRLRSRCVEAVRGVERVAVDEMLDALAQHSLPKRRSCFIRKGGVEQARLLAACCAHGWRHSPR